MTYEYEKECPACDAPARFLFGYNDPDPTVGYHGGPYLIVMRCDDGHTAQDLTEAQLRDVEERVHGWRGRELAAAKEEAEERRMDERRMGCW